MEKEMLDILACPACNSSVDLFLSVHEESKGDIREGFLSCGSCGSKFSIKNYISRFVPAENYAKSFGFQWNRHARTQSDKVSGINMS